MINLDKVMQEIKNLENLLSGAFNISGISAQKREKSVPATDEEQEKKPIDEIVKDNNTVVNNEALENNQTIKDCETIGGEINMEEKKTLGLNIELPDLGIGGSNNNGNHDCRPCCIPCIPCQPCDGQGLEGLGVCTGVATAVNDCSNAIILRGLTPSSQGTRGVIFDIQNLRCSVERCIAIENGVFVGVRWVVRVIGCIPYSTVIPVTRVLGNTTICFSPANLNAVVTTSGTACIDTVVASFETEAAARAFCDEEFECGDISATVISAVVSAAGSCDASLLTVVVRFVFDVDDVAGADEDCNDGCQ